MSEWGEVALGDLIEVHNSRRIPLSRATRQSRQGPYRYFGAQGVIDHVDDYIFDGEFVLVAEDGENLRSRKQPVARLVSGKFWVNNHAHIIRARDGRGDNRFLTHAINFAPLQGRITGAAQPKLTKANLQHVRLTCPSFGTQRRIAAILSAFDELIEINERRIELLEDLARSLYREWFVRFRFPGHEDVEFVDSEVGPIPAGWEVSDLNAVAVMHRRMVKPEAAPDTRFEHFSIPAFDAGQLPALEEGEAIRSSKYAIERDAVLVSKLNPRINRVWYAKPSSAAAVASTEFMVWAGEAVPNAWLWGLFDSEEFRSMMVGAAGGTSTSHQRVKPADAAQWTAPVAGRRVMAKFDQLASRSLEEAALLRGSNRALAATRDLLLPRLVTGRLDISDIDLGSLTPAESA